MRTVRDAFAEMHREEVEKQEQDIARLAIAVAVVRMIEIVGPNDPALALAAAALGGDLRAMASFVKAHRDQHYGRTLCNQFRREPGSVIELCGLDANHAGAHDFEHEPELRKEETT